MQLFALLVWRCNGIHLHAGETLVNVLDFKKDMGLWHGVLTVSDAHTHTYCMVLK